MSPAPAAYRLATGGMIDRARQIDFKFDSRSYVGHAGDTLASALLANDVRLVGRSFTYHRPRGFLGRIRNQTPLSNSARCGPNARATTVELFQGLVATSQIAPSLTADLLSVNALLSSVFAAGFYYKTFMWRVVRRRSTSRSFVAQPDWGAPLSQQTPTTTRK